MLAENAASPEPQDETHALFEPATFARLADAWHAKADGVADLPAAAARLLAGREFLALPGGGTLGFAALGSLTLLERLRGPLRWRGIVGTSIGALIGLLLALGLRPAEAAAVLAAEAARGFVDIVDPLRAAYVKGLVDLRDLEARIEEHIARIHGAPGLTLAGLHRERGVFLVTSATAMGPRVHTVYLSPLSRPQWPVARAVAVSMAFPGIFAPYYEAGCPYPLVDGGVRAHVPEYFPPDKTLTMCFLPPNERLLEPEHGLADLLRASMQGLAPTGNRPYYARHRGEAGVLPLVARTCEYVSLTFSGARCTETFVDGVASTLFVLAKREILLLHLRAPDNLLADFPGTEAASGEPEFESALAAELAH